MSNRQNGNRSSNAYNDSFFNLLCRFCIILKQNFIFGISKDVNYHLFSCNGFVVGIPNPKLLDFIIFF